jgi:hypothetical protein
VGVTAADEDEVVFGARILKHRGAAASQSEASPRDHL